MEWNPSTLWWIAAGVLVAAELASGSFYLLMLAIGAAAAAIAGHAGLGFNAQLLVAALVGGGAVAAWHLRRGSRPAAVPASRNRDVNLDIGETVHVPAWDAEANAQVQYRGATWSAHFAGPGMPRPGAHTIRAIEGNRLIVEPSPPNA